MNLAEKFYKLVSDLKKHGIAHGDLQHGNILVVNNGLSLVDYDGMFVPGLEGLPSNELGHPNYQHPLRSRNDFGPYLDNFSAWCIYISLLALAADPGLWDRINAGDEHICFRRKDIENPGSSQAIQAVEKIKNERVQGLFTLFKTIILCPDVCQIPSLDGAAIPKETPATGHKPVVNGSGWIQDYVKKPPVKTPIPSLFERAFAKALVLLSFCSFGFPFFTIFSDMTYSFLVLFVVVGFPILFITMYVKFSRFPENAKKAKITSEFKALQADFNKAEGSLAKLEEDRQRVDQEKARKFSDIDLKKRDNAQKESNEIARIDKDLRDSISSITSKKNSLVQEEATALNAALSNIQTQYLNSRLTQDRLESSSVIGIGPEMTRRLNAHGIRTAADIADVHIYQTSHGRFTKVLAYIEVPGRGNVLVAGIGPKKAEALLMFRKQAEKKIKSYLPTSLNSAQENAIKSEYFSKRQSLDSQETDAKKRAVNTKDTCKARYRKEQDELERQHSDARKNFAKRLEDLDKQIADARKCLADKRWKNGMVDLELKSYARFTFGRYVHSAFLR